MNNRSLYPLQRHALGLGFLTILVAAYSAGCDSVEFGGVAFRVKSPQYERAMPAASPADSMAEAPLPELPQGEVIFHVVRTDIAGAAAIQPLAEQAAGGLQVVGPRSTDVADAYVDAFTARYYQPGNAYSLYRSGAAVGSFYVEEPRVSGSGVCRQLEALGYLELRPPADTLSEFLARPGHRMSQVTGLEEPAARADMAAMAQILARRGLNDRDVAGSWRVGQAADLRALSVGRGDYGFASTFIFGDTLDTGPPADSAGMVFVVADYSPVVGFFPVFFDFDLYGPGHKRVLRWIDEADVMGDTTPEWVLKGYGDTRSWYEVVALSDTLRTPVWTSRQPVCEARPARGGG